MNAPARLIPLAACLALLASTPAARAASVPSTTALRLYGLVENFTWEEQFEGQDLLEEDGLLYGAGLDFAAPGTGSLWLLGRIEGYFGDVDYDGGLQGSDGSVLPYSTETTYWGSRSELLIASPLPLAGTLILWPLGGLGYRTWLRQLDKSLSDDTGPYGYEEHWSSLHGILGARADLPLADGKRLYALAELRLPFWNSERVDLSNVGGPDDAKIEPDEQTSLFAEGGLDFGKYFLAVYIETLEFEVSPVSDLGFLQPDSSGESVGGKLGFIF